MKIFLLGRKTFLPSFFLPTVSNLQRTRYAQDYKVLGSVENQDLTQNFKLAHFYLRKWSLLSIFLSANNLFLEKFIVTETSLEA